MAIGVTKFNFGDGQGNREINPLSTAPTFVSSTSYSVGDYVYYQGTLYKCTTAHSGVWNASHFSATTVSAELQAKESEIADVKSDLTQETTAREQGLNSLHDTLILEISARHNDTATTRGIIADEFSETRYYYVGTYCIYNNELWRCTVEHQGAWNANHFLEIRNVGFALDNLSYYATSQIEDIKENYAQIDGYYDEMAVGSAEQLISTKFTEDSVPYKYRTSGGSSDIGNRETDKIVGGTIAWNQLIDDRAITTRTVYGVTFTVNGSKSVTVNGTATATADFQYPRIYYTAGHKYLVGGMITVGSEETSGFFAFGGRRTSPTIINATNTDYFTPLIRVPSGQTVENLTLQPNIFDLTQMFGSTIADYVYGLNVANSGAGITWFKKLFPYSHYAYNAGELISVEGLSAHEMVGFNQWDEEWEVGGINDTTGANDSGTTSIRSKNHIRVLPNTTYYAKVGGNIAIRVFFYDANKNYLSYINTGTATFTTPTDAGYMRFRTYQAYGTTYKNDICINLSWSGWRNGEYEAYRKHSYPLDSTLTLRGIPMLSASNELYYDGDEYASDGTVTRRYKQLTIDQNSVIRQQNQGSTRFYIEVNDLIKTTNYIGKIFCDKLPTYVSYGSDPNADAYISGYPSVESYPGQNWIYFSNGTDAVYADIKAWLETHPLTVVYELATPTTETAQPYTNPQIVDDFGTEEYISTSITPVGHETQYMANLRDKLQHLPDLADTDGYYMINQSNHEMTLERFRIPKAPTTDGTYTLKATVNGGVPTYTWESEG